MPKTPISIAAMRMLTTGSVTGEPMPGLDEECYLFRRGGICVGHGVRNDVYWSVKRLFFMDGDQVYTTDGKHWGHISGEWWYTRDGKSMYWQDREMPVVAQGDLWLE
jgi:hypothetical protein